MNLSDDSLNKIVSTLHNSRKSHYSYVLTSDTKLTAYKATQKYINDSLQSNEDITALELVFCEMHFCEFFALQNTFSSGTQHFTIIDLSGCNIGDEGCISLCTSLMNHVVHINTLNLHSNSLTCASANFIVNLLQYCSIERLVLSQNKISEEHIRTSLSIHYSSNKAIKNFTHQIMLLVIVSSKDVHILHEICCIYLMTSSFDLEALLNVLSDKKQWCNIYHVNIYQKKIDTIIHYSNLALKLYTTPTENFEMLQQIVIIHMLVF